jgi:hypothetical protein
MPILRNKANSGSRPGVPKAKCAKQTQTWVSWGIWGTGRRGRTKGKCVKQTQFAPQGPAGRGTNKANWAGANYAKQTQFLPLCRSGDRRSREGNRATSPRCPASGNKANSEQLGRGRSTREEAVMRNKPKLGRSWGIWAKGGRAGQFCQTKPIPGWSLAEPRDCCTNKANSRHGVKTGKGLADKELW